MSNTPRNKPRTPSFTESEVDRWFIDEELIPAPSNPSQDLIARYSEAQLRIVRSTMDFSLHNLAHSLSDKSYIKLDPTYQRRNRWDDIKRSRLIESLLLNIPIPPLFLFENNYNQYEVMDGRQRLEAINDFLDSRYKLRGLEYWPELIGATFEDLPQVIQRGLLRRTISAIVLLAETSRADSSEIDVRMALFERLNTGGVKLNPQELRNALYPSPFNLMLTRITKWDTFRRCWGIPLFTEQEEHRVPQKLQANALYKTMADSELVLRFFAIRETISDGLSGSLRSLMDRSMRKHQKDSENRVAIMERAYMGTFDTLFELFDSHPFVLPKTGRPSRPVYDALMVAAADADQDDLLRRKLPIRAAFIASANDPQQYEVLVGRANSVEAISDRVALAYSILSA